MLPMLISYVLRLLPKINLFENTSVGYVVFISVILEDAVYWISHVLSQFSFVMKPDSIRLIGFMGFERVIPLFHVPAVLNFILSTF